MLGGKNNLEVGMVINLIDVFKTLLNIFQLWHVNHVKREVNMTAHCLAKVALQQSSEQIWMEDYLAFIHDIVISESITIWSNATYYHYLLKIDVTFKIPLDQNSIVIYHKFTI